MITANVDGGKVIQVFNGVGGTHRVIVDNEYDYLLNCFLKGKFTETIVGSDVLVSTNENFVVVKDENIII